MPNAIAGSIVVVVALSLGACNRISVSTNQTMNGTVTGSSFHLPAGLTVTLGGDLTIKTTGDIHIDGEIRPGNRVPASLTLESTQGSIHIAGNVQAGAGVNKPLVQNAGIAIAEAGGPGGSITLTAALDVFVRGQMNAGAGGQGGFARATGGAGSIYAEGGSGGPGGAILIKAGRLLDVNATVRGGAGGSAGWAQALLDGVPDIDANVVVDSPIAQADRDALNGIIERLRTQPEEIRTRAMSGAGGTGGGVTLQLAAAGREMLLQGEIRSGLGGTGAQATARFGHGAEAKSRIGGAAGDINISAAALQLHVVGTPPRAERGRESGPAVAYAARNAIAEAASGGTAGQVLHNSVKLSADEGGDGAAAIAQIFDPRLRAVEPLRAHAGEAPGAAAVVKVP